jgi:hypothetical protein
MMDAQGEKSALGRRIETIIARMASSVAMRPKIIATIVSVDKMLRVSGLACRCFEIKEQAKCHLTHLVRYMQPSFEYLSNSCKKATSKVR